MNMKKFALAALLLPAMAAAQTLTSEQNKQIEDIARQIAANTNAGINADTVAQGGPHRAESQGKNVTFVHFMKLRPNVSQEAINGWQRETEKEILPGACAVNKDNPAFSRGLSYTFSYRTRDEKQFMSVYVDRAKCHEKGLIQ